MTRWVMLGLGYSFLGLGVLGLVLPFLQGVLFILIGLIILSRHTGWAHRALERIRTRFPQVAGMIDKAEAIAERWVELGIAKARSLRGLFVRNGG